MPSMAGAKELPTYAILALSIQGTRRLSRARSTCRCVQRHPVTRSRSAHQRCRPAVSRLENGECPCNLNNNLLLLAHREVHGIGWMANSRDSCSCYCIHLRPHWLNARTRQPTRWEVRDLGLPRLVIPAAAGTLPGGSAAAPLVGMERFSRACRLYTDSCSPTAPPLGPWLLLACCVVACIRPDEILSSGLLDLMADLLSKPIRYRPTNSHSVPLFAFYDLTPRAHAHFGLWPM